MSYAEFYRRSIEQPEAFWDEQARLIDWHTPYTQVLDYSRAPFTHWYVGEPPTCATTRSTGIWLIAATKPPSSGYPPK